MRLRIIAIAGALVLKAGLVIAAGEVPFRIYTHIAEGWMGIGAAGYGIALTLFVGLLTIAAFAATSVLASAGLGRARMLTAALATTALFSVAGVAVLATWLQSSSDLRYDPAAIARGEYLKYPPFRAGQALLDVEHRFGGYVFFADVAITLCVVCWPRRRGPRAVLSTADTSRGST